LKRIIEVELSNIFSTRSKIKNEFFEVDKDGIKYENGFISREALLAILLNDNDDCNMEKFED
jgi:hypothetical protein